MRWEDAGLYALYQLQDGMCFHSGGEEEESAEGVSQGTACALESSANPIIEQNT
jgi:hypothetical protein